MGTPRLPARLTHPPLIIFLLIPKAGCHTKTCEQNMSENGMFSLSFCLEASSECKPCIIMYDPDLFVSSKKATLQMFTGKEAHIELPPSVPSQQPRSNQLPTPFVPSGCVKTRNEISFAAQFDLKVQPIATCNPPGHCKVLVLPSRRNGTAHDLAMARSMTNSSWAVDRLGGVCYATAITSMLGSFGSQTISPGAEALPCSHLSCADTPRNKSCALQRDINKTSSSSTRPCPSATMPESSAFFSHPNARHSSVVTCDNRFTHIS